MDAAACMPEDFKKLLALGLQNARRISTVDQILAKTLQPWVFLRSLNSKK